MHNGNPNNGWAEGKPSTITTIFIVLISIVIMTVFEETKVVKKEDNVIDIGQVEVLKYAFDDSTTIISTAIVTTTGIYVVDGAFVHTEEKVPLRY